MFFKFCLSRVSVQMLHTVFAVFIWSSSWERTSRTNLFRSVRSGGIGLSHLLIRQVVPLFLFLRDQLDLVLRTVIHVCLRNMLPEFVVSSGRDPCLRVQGYLREVVLFFSYYESAFCF